MMDLFVAIVQLSGIPVTYLNVSVLLTQTSRENRMAIGYTPAHDLECLLATIDERYLAKQYWAWMKREVYELKRVTDQINIDGVHPPQVMVLELVRIITAVQKIMMVEPIPGFDYRPYLVALQDWRVRYDAL